MIRALNIYPRGFSKVAAPPPDPRNPLQTLDPNDHQPTLVRPPANKRRRTHFSEFTNNFHKHAITNISDFPITPQTW